jgi:hypothetical protein
MPVTINRLAIQNKTVSVRKSTKIPLSKFNTLNFPQSNSTMEFKNISVQKIPVRMFQTGNLENNYIQ